MDTNVVLVANGQHADVSSMCVAACALRLQAIMTTHHLVLDDNFLILQEYLQKTTPKKGNRPGDAFVKWAHQNNANSNRVDCVALKHHPTRCFDSFPDERELDEFDPPDRKFVAVAAAHSEQPAILQAVDSKWLTWEAALRRHGVTVDFLCPDDIKRFQAKKAGG